VTFDEASGSLLFWRLKRNTAQISRCAARSRSLRAHFSLYRLAASCIWVAFRRYREFFGEQKLPVATADAEFIRWLEMRSRRQ
jgi:hypothetical protein